GAWAYNPDPDFYGNVSFSYVITDGNGAKEVINNSFSVTNLNDLPFRAAGNLSKLTLLEDSPRTSLGLAGLSYSPGNNEETSQTLTYTVTQLPSGLGQVGYDASGSFVVLSDNATISASQLGSLQFQASPNATGTAQFSFRVSDSGTDPSGANALALSQSIDIELLPVNDAPQLINTGSTTTNSTLAVQGAQINADGGSVRLVFNGIYPNASTLDVNAITVSVNGTVIPSSELFRGSDLILAGNRSAVDIAFHGSRRVSPADTIVVSGIPGALTTTSFSTTAIAGELPNPTNNATSSAPFSLGSIQEDASSYTIYARDILSKYVDVDSSGIFIEGIVASKGSLSQNGSDASGNPTSWTYTPDANFNGFVDFDFLVADNQGGKVLGKASLTVNSLNDAPYRIDGSGSIQLGSIQEDSSGYTISASQLLSSFSDIDSSGLTISSLILNNSNAGTLTPQTNASGGYTNYWTFSPSPNFNGLASFSVAVFDGQATTYSAASLTVN
ncbi:MAG: tandem-95 repeat protein, partial [Flavobacteriia bacterium]|nr:tandem-95 repeat protein [Flavobacteriia bacterium]